ncbi:MAG: hypothetical protein R2864_11745 [Syntrophotaleaceae bacterium]
MVMYKPMIFIADIKEMLPSSEVSVDFIGAHDLVARVKKDQSVFRLQTVEAPLSTSEKVFIALTNIKDYYGFISDDSGKLLRHIFESNVRDYQGKTNVNKEIQETLTSKTRKNFGGSITVLLS